MTRHNFLLKNPPPRSYFTHQRTSLLSHPIHYNYPAAALLKKNETYCTRAALKSPTKHARTPALLSLYTHCYIAGEARVSRGSDISAQYARVVDRLYTYLRALLRATHSARCMHAEGTDTRDCTRARRSGVAEGRVSLSLSFYYYCVRARRGPPLYQLLSLYPAVPIYAYIYIYIHGDDGVVDYLPTCFSLSLSSSHRSRAPLKLTLT